MSDHGVPEVYLDGDGSDADANHMISLACAKWHRLSTTQQDALIGAHMTGGPPRLTTDYLVATRKALVRAKVASKLKRGPYCLTGIGIMVREAGLLARGLES